MYQSKRLIKKLAFFVNRSIIVFISWINKKMEPNPVSVNMQGNNNSTNITCQYIKAIGENRFGLPYLLNIKKRQKK